ncbi:hypothetical protein RB614_35080 [Phytohabitans sp. ZYX-F-186]|uniref:Uncharacterized protein n=1 Tax=Phytohabitans maris TaxID=3071409 RepID=A0ABU0ZS19_9ACTN|nr:hypothetical protein [Phytohabitans sp. ZYX-F-186]MDQ7909758.1 hypothetical protein [Phytohabitans sp. ZYX-F-186]
MAGSQYRQGDVLVVAVERLPDGLTPVAREDGAVVLAHGEATGHRHAIREPHAELLEGRGERFLRIAGGPARLVHEEHDPIVLPAGAYQVIRQREYQPAAWPRTVAD